MKKLSLPVILFLGCLQNLYAQTEVMPPAAEAKKDKTSDQYIGVQLNGLIRQVFNFNNSTGSTIVNPYLLTYSNNSKRTGWGIRAGVGYNYSSTSSDDGITSTTTKLNDLQLRVGVEKLYKLSANAKWTAGVGLDAVVNMNNDNTSNTIHSGDTTTTATKSTMLSYGGGPMALLRYAITDKILIGTEASFYFVTGTNKTTIDVTNTTSVFGGSGGSVTTTTETKTKPTVSQGTFSSPIVFYLTVKF